MKVDFRLENIADRLTTQKLAIYMDGVPFWPMRGLEESLEIQIDDLLAHLTEFWKPLMLRQTYPLDLNPVRPSLLLAAAKESWADKPEKEVDREDEQIGFFRDCHDISQCFAGYFDLPVLWMLRSGDKMLLDTAEGDVEHVDFDAARLALETAGNTIATRLSANQGRWGKLIAAWNNRDLGDEFRLLSWSTSLDETVARDLAEKGLLGIPRTVSEAANDNDELRIAARMASALPPEQIENILAMVHAIPRQDAKSLEYLGEEVRNYLDREEPYARPFEQGEAAARYVRQALGIGARARADVFEVAESIGVNVIVGALQPSTLDGLAVSGRSHGPAAWLNTDSDRHAGPGAPELRGQVRITLAHELCHLLLDGKNALGAVDVLRSKMPKAIEQRARAFAGEFLLPTEAAMYAWRDAHHPTNPDDLAELLQQLCEDYTVSKSVASWKVQHGARDLGADLSHALDVIVPQR